MSKTVNINNTKINLKNILKKDTNESKEETQEQEAPVEETEQTNNQPENNTPEIDYQEEDNPEDKRKRLLVISRYKNSKRFSKFLKDQGFNFNTKHISGLSNEELETMINDIRFCISTKNTNNMIEQVSTKGIVLLENLLRPVYNIDGLSQVLTNDQTYLDLVEELTLEHSNYFYVKPEYRLMYCVTSSAYIIHTQKIMLDNMKKTPEGQIMIQKMAKEINEQKEKENEKNNVPVIQQEPKIIKTKEMSSEFIKSYGDILV